MFNTKQNEAITYNGLENVAVIAGAGSGKTSVFVERINYLVETLNISKNSILALTFTEKAANEFKKRSEYELKYFGTFHSVFYKLLQEYNVPFYKTKILDERAYEYYLKNSLEMKVLTDKEFEIKVGNAVELDKFINEHLELILKCETINDFYELILEKLVDIKHFTGDNIVEKFFEKKRKNDLFSFTDIIIYTYFDIKNNADRFEDKFHYILVDEFQDTNKIVLEILNMLNCNIFYVGDIYQSIYSFQGSSFEKSLDIIEHSYIIQLDTNYRSSENIVDYANYFLADTVKEKIAGLEPVKPGLNVKNNPVAVYENISDFTIPELIFKSNDKLEDICILARNNNHIVEIKKHLDKWNVPYNKKNYREFEYLLDALLLMIVDQYELTDTYFERFDFEFSDYAGKHIIDHISYIQSLFYNTGIENYFENRDISSLRSRFEKWEDKQYRVFKSTENLDIYLDTMKQNLEYFLVNKLYVEKSGVNVMTIHKAKGLEWNTVILYNFQDGIFPRNIFNEEEKRLYYVAITRAKENMVITSKKAVNSYTNKDLKYIDSFSITKQQKYELTFENRYLDYINFKGEADAMLFNEMTLDEYKKLYRFTNRELIIQDYVKNYNKLKHKEIVDAVNDITIEDIEIALLEIEDFKATNNIDNIELKEIIENIDTSKELYFENDKINADYLNNDFTDVIHHIINFKNWVNDTDIDIKNDEREIKKFKSIVKELVSKKNTDLAKDKAKKYIEKFDANINHKYKNSYISSFQDFKDYMIKKYYKKSQEQKKFFVHNVLGMTNNITGENMIDLTNEKFDAMKRDIIIDFQHNGKNYFYDKEKLAGNFLNQNKTIQAHKRWGKLKYLEHINRDKRAFFITNTLNSSWHKWKHNFNSIKEERKYGEDYYLIDNENFEMQGNNLEEHFINSAKEILKIWTYFYHILKIDIEHYKKKNKIDKEFEVAFFRQLEAHKNLTSHIHFLIFVDEEVQHLVNIAFHKTISKFSLNKKFQDIQKINKEADNTLSEEESNKIFIEIMELQGKLEVESNIKNQKGLRKRLRKLKQMIKNNFSSPASYIGKYMLKNAFKNENDNLLNSESLEFFNAWESMLGNSVKITGMSNYKHTTQKHIDTMYKWYQENAPEKLVAVKRTGKPIYHFLEQEEVKGNFTFTYERKIKENFKNSAFMKDVEFIFRMLKIDNLTLETLETAIDKYEIDFDIEKLSFVLLNRSESDMFLWELAQNFVLNNQDKAKYKNIHTNKKLVEVLVSEKLIYKYSKTNYVNAVEKFQYKKENQHLSFVPTEWSFQWTLLHNNWKLTDEIKHNAQSLIKNTVIYIEDMYVNGYIEADDITETVEWNIFITLKEHIGKISRYHNYSDNVEESLKCSFKTNELIHLEAA